MSCFEQFGCEGDRFSLLVASYVLMSVATGTHRAARMVDMRDAVANVDRIRCLEPRLAHCCSVEIPVTESDDMATFVIKIHKKSTSANRA